MVQQIWHPPEEFPAFQVSPDLRARYGDRQISTHRP